MTKNESVDAASMHPIVQPLYLVVDKRGNALILCDAFDSSQKLLMVGNEATLFRNRRAANRAIERTKKFEIANNLHWDTWAWRVIRARVG